MVRKGLYQRTEGSNRSSVAKFSTRLMHIIIHFVYSILRDKVIKGKRQAKP